MRKLEYHMHSNNNRWRMRKALCSTTEINASQFPASLGEIYLLIFNVHFLSMEDIFTISLAEALYLKYLLLPFLTLVFSGFSTLSIRKSHIKNETRKARPNLPPYAFSIDDSKFVEGVMWKDNGQNLKNTALRLFSRNLNFKLLDYRDHFLFRWRFAIANIWLDKRFSYTWGNR